MRAPRFWTPDEDGKVDWRAHALAPLGRLYAGATAMRLARATRRREFLELGGEIGGPGKPGSGSGQVPVICVGNLAAGGSGKTPTVIWVVERLRDAGHEPHVVTRGYGGTLRGPLSVNPARHDAGQCGDEPLMLAAFAEVWVSRDRALGVRAAESAGATAIVLDDGFQNGSVRKDFSLLVADAASGFGNGYCIPAGPLREPVATGLARADHLLTLGDDDAQERFERRWGPSASIPRSRGLVAPLHTGMDWTGLPVLAFAGIAYPDRFFATLKSLGADVRRTEPLDDHQPLTSALLARLEADARSMGAQLVTTEKDMARIPRAFRTKAIALPVRLGIAQDDPLRKRLTEIAPLSR